MLTPGVKSAIADDSAAPTGTIQYIYTVQQADGSSDEPVTNQISGNYSISESYGWTVPSELVGKTILVTAQYSGDDYYQSESNAGVEVKLEVSKLNSISAITRNDDTYSVSLNHNNFEREGSHYYYMVTPLQFNRIWGTFSGTIKENSL